MFRLVYDISEKAKNSIINSYGKVEGEKIINLIDELGKNYDKIKNSQNPYSINLFHPIKTITNHIDKFQQDMETIFTKPIDKVMELIDPEVIHAFTTTDQEISKDAVVELSKILDVSFFTLLEVFRMMIIGG